MMLKRVREFARRGAVSLLISAAVLSVANIDMIWEERSHQSRPDVIGERASRNLQERLKKSLAQDAEPSALLRLRTRLAQDEIGGANPFAALTTLSPLTDLMKRGVVEFRRQAYRSPKFRDETGYDLVEYEITHSDGSRSALLAYLEYPLREADPDQSVVPVVLVMRSEQGAAKQALFRDGRLIEEGDLTLAQVAALVSHKVNEGIPFISVSR